MMTQICDLGIRFRSFTASVPCRRQPSLELSFLKWSCQGTWHICINRCHQSAGMNKPVCLSVTNTLFSSSCQLCICVDNILVIRLSSEVSQVDYNWLHRIQTGLEEFVAMSKLRLVKGVGP